jgi:dTDP-4-dehydrorhamnose reductase
VKILLLGAAGQVGRDCEHALRTSGYDVTALTRNELDFIEPATISAKVLAIEPDVVINACAYTAVDKAETERQLADLVNHQSVAVLASTCLQLAIPLIHLSTDYVFDGTAHVPYLETDTVNPLGVYGASKLAGEEVIQQSLPQHIILRTSWVFGEQGTNFVKTMLRLASERDHLRVVKDQYGRPTYVGDLIRVILFLLDRYQAEKTLPWGIYHCSSEGETSWHGFAEAIFDIALSVDLIQKKPTVEAIESVDFATPAPRPAYSVLDTTKLHQLMGSPMPHWRLGLQQFLINIKNQ